VIKLDLHSVSSRPANALPISCEPAAWSASVFYTMSLRRDWLLQRHYGSAGLRPGCSPSSPTRRQCQHRLASCRLDRAGSRRTRRGLVENGILAFRDSDKPGCRPRRFRPLPRTSPCRNLSKLLHQLSATRSELSSPLLHVSLWDPSNALPFSGVGAAKLALRFYADVAAATTSAATALWHLFSTIAPHSSSEESLPCRFRRRGWVLGTFTAGRPLRATKRGCWR
jgi:hypothetical protein